MNKFLLFILLLILAVVGIAGYLGLIPAISKIIGSDKPRDLGIKATSIDRQTVVANLGAKLETIPLQTKTTGETVIYSGQKPLKVSLTSTDLTALAQDRGWIYYPVSDVQIKINPDGTAEASGIARLDRLINYVEAMGEDSGSIKMVMDALHLSATGMPFYVKGTASVLDNKVTLDISQAEIGRIPVPQDLVSKYKNEEAAFVEQKLQAVHGLSVKSMDFSDGKMNFDGTIPETETVVTAQ